MGVSTHAFQSRRMITGGEGGFDEIGCILVMAGHSVGRRHADQRVEAGCTARGAPAGRGGGYLESANRMMGGAELNSDCTNNTETCVCVCEPCSHRRERGTAVRSLCKGGLSLPTTCAVACVCLLCCLRGGWATKAHGEGRWGESGFDNETFSDHRNFAVCRISQEPDPIATPPIKSTFRRGVR